MGVQKDRADSIRRFTFLLIVIEFSIQKIPGNLEEETLYGIQKQDVRCEPQGAIITNEMKPQD
jgi:hypothetical protein